MLGEEPITNFGIRAINYKLDDTMRTSSGGMETYMLTSNTFEASQCWLPQLFGSTRQPINWSMHYLVPKGNNVISSGNFIKQINIKEKTLLVYKLKTQKIIPDKVGFIIGEFPHVSILDKNSAALFVSN